MRSTWYILEDGRVVDPAEVVTDESGALRHQDGVAVAMRGQTPSSRGVDLADRDLLGEPAGGAGATKDVNADDGKAMYKTRESKAK